ncbi:hypothetical protein E2C01_039090 [Portunus trituberculatus]|uniref:Uncharacterized protein n=1 Tax=Portunus trituberculatus TaxID=210409 RepID=A0A5B7FFY0_PORTR|nr:hypothetical protein [Portunus trituberculatus]
MTQCRAWLCTPADLIHRWAVRQRCGIHQWGLYFMAVIGNTIRPPATSNSQLGMGGEELTWWWGLVFWVALYRCSVFLAFKLTCAACHDEANSHMALRASPHQALELWTVNQVVVKSFALIHASHSQNNFMVWFDLILHFFCCIFLKFTLRLPVSNRTRASSLLSPCYATGRDRGMKLSHSPSRSTTTTADAVERSEQ